MRRPSDKRVEQGGSGSEDAVRARVRQIMDVWQAYPDFATLLSALLQATAITATDFARQYAEATGKGLPAATISGLKTGRHEPSYQLIADIAEHALLSLDREQLGSAEDPYRVALFTVAGFLEVTPASIRSWNEQTLAQLTRAAGQPPGGPMLTWKYLMRRLVSFHTQGNRSNYDQLAEVANRLHPASGLNRSRLGNLLSRLAVIPTRDERLALAAAVGLEPSQITALEYAIEHRRVLLTQKPAGSPFAAALRPILRQLRNHGIDQTHLIALTRKSPAPEVELNDALLSSWKHSKTSPREGSLRTLIAALQSCHDSVGRPIVSDEQLEALAVAAGFSIHELRATTHDIIARIDDATRIKPLLAALRHAADLGIPRSALQTLDNDTSLPGGSANWNSRLSAWEHESIAIYPTPAQVRDLLARYNRLLTAKGQLQMQPGEIKRVLAVAARDREEALRQGFRGRPRKHRPRRSRRDLE